MGYQQHMEQQMMQQQHMKQQKQQQQMQQEQQRQAPTTYASTSAPSSSSSFVHQGSLEESLRAFALPTQYVVQEGARGKPQSAPLGSVASSATPTRSSVADSWLYSLGVA